MPNSIRVLLIEDDRTNPLRVAELIEPEADFVLAVKSVGDVVRAPAGMLHDVVVLDLGAADDEGLETIALVRRAVGETPIVVLAGPASRDLAAAVVRRGAEDCLSKTDLRRDDLFRAIRYAVERRRHWQVRQDLRDYEALYRSLADSLPVCLLRKDVDGRFEFVNRAYCEFTGHAFDEIIGRTDFDFSPPDVARKFQEDDRVVAASGRLFEDVEVNETDGRTTWVQVIKTPIHDSRGSVVGTQAIFWDVTERHEAVEALKRAKVAAEEANRSKSEFLANMSHEIRTPLNAVIGMTELVLGTKLSEVQREYLGMVRDSGELLLSVINDILDFSKIEAGKMDLDAAPFSLRDGIGDTAKLMAQRVAEADVELTCYIAPDVPDSLLGDVNRLRQVVVNLLGNAIKFTSEGEIRLVVQRDAAEGETADNEDTGRVTTEDDVAGGNVATEIGENEIVLRFAVHDTGIGIPEDKLKSIFEAFEQADNSATRRFTGTGLGLAISSRLVELMGGEMSVASEVDRGSTFEFTARFVRAAEPPPRRLGRDVRGTRVLVVDDLETNRRILAEMLRNWEMQPTVAGGVAEAEALLREAHGSDRPFELVLSDYNMPDRDGTELLNRLKQDPDLGATVIMMLTSSDPPVTDWRRGGAAGWLMKPVKQSELFDAIVEALGVDEVSDARNETEPAEETTRPLEILVVEDSVTNQRLALGLLGRWGHDVSVAGNGREALDVLEERAFDLVLMDVQMPEMDGLEATRAIRERERSTGAHLPIVAMTAHAMKGDREACLEAGMDDYVSKPIRAEQLGRVLRSLSEPETGAEESASRPG